MDVEGIQKALRGLQESAGPRADATLTIKPGEVSVYFRPTGWGSDEPFVFGRGETPQDAIADAAKAWSEMSSRVHAEQTKKLALAIIRITHEQGQCTDAALRVDFPSQDIERYRSAALTLANAMAENGPFEIVELVGANAA